MEADSSIVYQATASQCQSFLWNSRGEDADACEWRETIGRARLPDEASSSTHCDHFTRHSHRCPRSGAPSHHPIDFEPVHAFVGSVHHHYPNHSSVKAIHPNSQIFRPCYPETPYSRSGAREFQSERPLQRQTAESEVRGQAEDREPTPSKALDDPPPTDDPNSPLPSAAPSYPLTDLQQARHARSNRCCANCSSSATVREQGAPAQRSERDSRDREPLDRANGGSSSLDVGSAELRRRDGVTCPESDDGGGQRSEVSFESHLQVEREHFRRPHDSFHQRCCAYHPQHRENLLSRDSSQRDERAVVADSEWCSPTEGRRRARERRSKGGEAWSDGAKCWAERGGYGDAAERGAAEEERPRAEQVAAEDDASSFLLLQEQLRVLLWALLGSERLASAAAVAALECESARTCWSNTPIRDLLGAIMGACGCPECRPRRSFSDLAYSLLNMCPPLSERLAEGGPKALTRVVDSVYQNDLMPSLTTHEADFPDGVRRSMARVARLEWTSNREPSPPPAPDGTTRDAFPLATPVEEIEDSSREDILIMQDELKMTPLLKDGGKIQRKFELKMFNNETQLKTEADRRKERLSGGNTKRERDWLHPHHHLLMEGLANDHRTHLPKRSPLGDGDLRCLEENDPRDSRQPRITSKREHHKFTQGEIPIGRRKRGRPPKADGQKKTASPRKKRTLLWKFLIALLDETESNNHQKKTPTRSHMAHEITAPHSSNCNPRPLELHQHGASEQFHFGPKDVGAIFNSSHDCGSEHELKIFSQTQPLETNKHDADTRPSCSSSACLQWICREDGLFRILDTVDLAKRWGFQHRNPKMTYEKMSRAMRTYYQCKLLVPVPRSYNLPKKLVYKFNPSILKKIPPSLPKKINKFKQGTEL